MGPFGFSLLLSFFHLAAGVLAEGDRDAYGGTTAIRGKKTGYFHVERIGGRAWLITPEGSGFLSKGINHWWNG